VNATHVIAIYSKVSMINRRSLKGVRRSPWKPRVVLRMRGSKRGG
jgi:hypothetical protein